MSRLVNYLAPSLGGALTVIGVAYLVADQLVVDMPAPARGTLNARAAMADSEPEPDSADVATIVLASGDPAVSKSGGYGLGRPATEEEVAAWDIDIRPDGMGLPPGSGDVWTGEELYTDNCAMCHGDFGEAVDRWPVLAGGQGSLTRERPVKTIGSYWPYLSTVWDYVHRAMPFGNARSLSPDDVYAITAYLLYLNDLVDDDFTLSQDNFTEVEMPNEAHFFMDDRAEGELKEFVGEVCMTDCKSEVEITARAAVLDVTPEDAAAREAREAARQTSAALADAATPVPTEEIAAAEPTYASSNQSADIDPALVAAGEKAFKKCSACHQVGPDAVNRTGPVLNGVVGRHAGAVEDFAYSKAMEEKGEEGLVWDEDALSAFLAKPKSFLKGTKMSFAGLRKEDEIAAVIAYLQAQDS